MVGHWLRLLILFGLCGGLIALGCWAWLEGQEERKREEVRELSIKVPPRRVIDPETHETFIRLDRETQNRLGLVTEPVERVARQKSRKLLGFSIQVPHRTAQLRTPWTGVLEAPPGESFPTLGQELRRGELLGSLIVQWSPSDRIQLENLLRDAKGTMGETE